MRFNDWQHDPLSRGSPGNAIMSRYDLIGKHPVANAFGGIDTKVTSYLHGVCEMKALAVNGPTHAQQPVFQWEQWDRRARHLGQPESFDFGWEAMVPEGDVKSVC